MKILLIKKRISPGLYANPYSSDHCRHDDFRMLGHFLIDEGWNPYIMEWLQGPDDDETITDHLLCIERINSRIKIYFPDPEDGILVDPIPYDSFYEWASPLVKLCSDFYALAEASSPNEIAVIRQLSILFKAYFSSEYCIQKSHKKGI
ncbi:MAG: hypothetical protein WA432_02045 [Candidatus Babeliaceae bacterium]